MRRQAARVAAALAVASAAAVVAGSAGAQVVAVIAVVPGTTDPGGVVSVSNGPTSPCPPPGDTRNPSASVDLFAPGSATPANRVPYQAAVSAAGTWTVEVRLAPDLSPGTYQVRAGCYRDSGLNARYGPAYESGRLDLRLQQPGQATVTPRRARPGEMIQVGSGEARCTPPTGSPSPRVRVSLLDAATATRAEAEAAVDSATGRWSVDLRVPDIGPQPAEVTAVCLARVAAPAPYARYRGAPFTVDRAPSAAPPMTPPVTVAPIPTVNPGAVTTVPVPATTPPTTLPQTPLAKPIPAEPTYTG